MISGNHSSKRNNDIIIWKLTGWGAISAPAIHTLTDIFELIQQGFSQSQLWLNYIAFLILPAVILGLYAFQRPRISMVGLSGALLYGFAFIYFAHTSLYALTENISTYEHLWNNLGLIYTIHGAIMVAGGLMFGFATFKVEVFPRWTVWLFLAGIIINFVVALLPVPDLIQTIGSTVRNAGLIGMGWEIVKKH